MSSQRRLSKQSDPSGELIYECKAAFLAIYDDISDKIESKKRLNNVLQQSGRNPTKASLDKYWPRNKEEMSFDEFVEVCRKEPVTKAEDLINAFKKIDINGDGYISLDELYKIMNAQGEHMSREDVRKMIDEVDENKDGKLDYGEFTNMIMKTTEESKQFSKKVMERKERKKRRAGKTSNAGADISKHEPDVSSHKSHDHDDESSESPKKDSPKASPRSRSDSGGKNGLKKGTPREHAVKDSGMKETPRHHAKHDKPPLPDSPKTKDTAADKSKSHKTEKVDTPKASGNDVPRPSPRVKRDTKGKTSTKGRDKLPDSKSLHDWMHYTSKGCFFYEEEEIVTHVYSLKLTEDSCVYLSAQPIQEPTCLNLPGTEPVDTALFIFDSRGKFVTCTELRDTSGKYGVKCDLSAGEYQVLPYTTGCRFKQRTEESQENMKESKLVKTKDDKVVITSAFRRALEDIFDLCDLDNNGTMSRDEFNWFNLRTSGEELGEDEWEVVEEKTALQNGEITKQGFIELNEMEAEDAQGDVEDLWITLNSMGMNKGLIMDEACPYRVDVYVEESGRKRPSFKVIGIESLEKKEFVSEICNFTIEKADEPTKIRNMKDLYMYTYRNEFRGTIVIDNRSRSTVSLQANCSRSKNVVSNRPSLNHTVEVEPQSLAIAHHLLPKSELSDWTVSCTENILK